MIRAAVAQTWGAAIAKACDQPFPDCKRCRRPGNSNLRRLWGCDEEALHVVWESSCALCVGTDEDCPRCDGTGVVGQRRCPQAILAGAPRGLQLNLDLLLRAYSQYDRRNVLPARGALIDQTRSFLSWVDAIDAERGFWEQVRIDQMDRERKRSEALHRQSRAKNRGR